MQRLMKGRNQPSVGGTLIIASPTQEGVEYTHTVEKVSTQTFHDQHGPQTETIISARNQANGFLAIFGLPHLYKIEAYIA